jgi:hypothetical protein
LLLSNFSGAAATTVGMCVASLYKFWLFCAELRWSEQMYYGELVVSLPHTYLAMEQHYAVVADIVWMFS